MASNNNIDNGNGGIGGGGEETTVVAGVEIPALGHLEAAAVMEGSVAEVEEATTEAGNVVPEVPVEEMMDTQARATSEEGRATVEGDEAAVAAVNVGGDAGGSGGMDKTGAVETVAEVAEATVQMVGGEVDLSEVSVEATVDSQDRAILGEGRATAEEGEAVLVEAVVGAEAVVTEIAGARVTGEAQGRASMEEARAMISGRGISETVEDRASVAEARAMISGRGISETVEDRASVAEARAMVEDSVNAEVAGVEAEVAGDSAEVDPVMEGIFDDLERDRSRGKGTVSAESPERQVPATTEAEVPLFTPQAGTSSHQPIRRADFLEFLGEEHLEELGRDHPSVLATVLRMRDQHMAGQARREEEVASVMEAEASARRQENAARAREEARERRVTAVEEAGRQSSPGFTDGVPNLPETHLIVPGGGDTWEMKREIYSDDQGFRDREYHLRTSWQEV